jgi:hypothetical protein
MASWLASEYVAPKGDEAAHNDVAVDVDVALQADEDGCVSFLILLA